MILLGISLFWKRILIAFGIKMIGHKIPTKVVQLILLPITELVLTIKNKLPPILTKHYLKHDFF